MGKKIQTRTISLSATGMVETIIAGCMWAMKPADQRTGRKPTFKELERLPFRMDHNEILDRIGRSLSFKKHGIAYTINLPGADILADAIELSLPVASQESDEFADLVGLGEGDPTMTELIERIENLSEEKLPNAIYLLKRKTAVNAAISLVFSRIRKLALDPVTSHLVYLSRGDLQDLDGHIQRIAEQLGVLIYVMQSLEWSAQSRQLSEQDQFLPPGMWSRGEPKEDKPEDEKDVMLGPEVDKDDVRLDRDRDAFYMNELGCRHRLEPQGWFGGRRYVAYMYRAPSGEMIAILDCNTVGNAAYIFRVGTPVARHPELWKSEARRTKLDLLTASDLATFERRFIHAGKWRLRLKEWLEGTYPAAS